MTTDIKGTYLPENIQTQKASVPPPVGTLEKAVTSTIQVYKDPSFSSIYIMAFISHQKKSAV